MIAFSTASSEAALPKLFEQLDRFGIPRRISGFMLPLGYYDWRAMLSAAVVGAVGGFLVAWLVAKRIQATDPKDSL